MSLTPQDRVAAFNSTGLFHAYGPAIDTQQLADLFGDENARERALEYLYSAILHQGTPWTATAPVVNLLVECLALEGAACARHDILEFCTDVAEAVTGTDPACTPESERAEIEARRAGLDPAAIATWAQIAATGDKDAYQEAFKDDQVCGAMFSGALRDPVTLDAVFEDGPPRLDLPPSITAIPRVISRVGTTTAFDEADVVDIAIASARTSGELPGDWAWGLYLPSILRGARPGQPLGPQPRRYLAALVELDLDAEQIWNSRHDNNSRCFRGAGLPHDRKVCRELAQGAPWPAPPQG